MDKASLAIVAMAEQCRTLIRRADDTNSLLPPPLQAGHLLWMCDRIEQHAEKWPATRLHRWIGFVQCAMMANRILDLDGVKAMFARVKIAYAETDRDGDLLDHLDPDSTFELEVGGEG